LPCAVCGKVLKVHDNARDDRSCSLLCRMIAGGELPRDAADRLPSEPCAACGTPVKMNRNFTQPRYCDEACSRRASQNRKMGRPESTPSMETGCCKVCGTVVELEARPGPLSSYCRIHHPKQSRRRLGFWLPAHGIGTCSWCGDWYGRSYPQQSTCSPKCGSQLRALGPIPAAKYRAEYRRCTVCNEEFQTTMKRRKYCGKAICKGRGRPWTPQGLKEPYASKSRYVQLRRAAEAVGDRTLTTLTIYEKAGGVCAACGIDTLHPQTPRGERSRRRFNWATLDHIVPLSQGGGHTWDNAQLLCLSCNSRKSHTDRAKQLEQVS
jgi:5-methylcytosine-specific restriction endonuclease McrA